MSTGGIAFAKTWRHREFRIIIKLKLVYFDRSMDCVFKTAGAYGRRTEQRSDHKPIFMKRQ